MDSGPVNLYKRVPISPGCCCWWRALAQIVRTWPLTCGYAYWHTADWMFLLYLTKELENHALSVTRLCANYSKRKLTSPIVVDFQILSKVGPPSGTRSSWKTTGQYLEEALLWGAYLLNFYHPIQKLNFNFVIFWVSTYLCVYSVQLTWQQGVLTWSAVSFSRQLPVFDTDYWFNAIYVDFW